MSHINFKKPLNVCRASAGTGKTYNLAAYYIGLLLSGVNYRSILAVTFTNNATFEMKERIMSDLYQLKEGQNQKFLDRAKEYMTVQTNENDGKLRERAGECFKRMLLDYDNVHVQTIDSFLLNLQSGLAAVLKMSAGYTPELDSERVITQAVDQMLTTSMTDTARSLIENYVKANLEAENTDDIRDTLISMAKELYNESVQMLDADNRILFDAEAIDAYRKRLDEAWETNEDVVQLKDLLAKMYKVDTSLTNGGALNTAIDNISDSLNNPKSVDNLFRGLTDTQLLKAESNGWKALPADLVDLVVKGTYIARRCQATYNTIQLSKQFTYDLQLMSELRAIIQRNLVETNRTLLAQTAAMLHKALKEGDADFILEKVGIRYHHVLLDEFQDTSKLQWTIFNLLIKELVAGENNSILVVGDIKQSIYRWRNGDWHTMYELGRKDENGNADNEYVPYVNAEFPRLERNHRSSKEVVQFNLSLFKYICEQYADFAYVKGVYPNAREMEQVQEIYNENFSPEKVNEYYKSDDPDKSGGYVCFRAFQKEKGNENINALLAQDMFDQIEELLQQGITPDQIMILVRGNKDTDTIIDEYNRLDKSQYEKLSQVAFATENSYKLLASQDVRMIIAILKFVVQKRDQGAEQEKGTSIYEEQIRKWLPDCDLDQLSAQIRLDASLFETICDIVRLYLCDSNGEYVHQEHAYLDSFLDYVRSYVASEGGTVDDFLTYWDDILCDKSISMNSSNAIRIMTVHKSKGLEAQTLFVPFCNWDATISANKSPKVWSTAAIQPEGRNIDISLPIQYGKEMNLSDYKAEYEQERHNLRIDNLNLLYVALTRARDNLFVYTDCNKEGKASNSVGEYLLRFLDIKSDEFNENGYVEREFGTITKGKEKSNDGPFKFEHATKQNSQLWSDGRTVRFVQSQEGQLYTSYGEEAARLVERMEEGTLCHDIFAHIHTLDQLDNVLDEFESRGEIANPEQRETLKALISSAWECNEKVRGWFTDPWKLQLESSIFQNRKEIRPDRVMIDEERKKAIVLDYKFGKFTSANHKKYIDQVHKYMQAMRNLGYTDVEGYLWYAQNPQNEQLKQV